MLLRLLSSDWLKTKRTPLRWLTAAVTLGFPSLFLWYYSGSARTAALPGEIHEAFFQAVSILLPVGIGLLAGLLATSEENAGDFNGLLSQNAPRAMIYLSKLALLLMLVFTILSGSILILLAGMHVVLQLQMPYLQEFMLSGILAFAGTLALCVLHLFLSLAWGLGASLAAGGAGLLIAAIIGTTSIGDAIWQAVPWSWPARLAQIPVSLKPGARPLEGIARMSEEMLKGLFPACAVFLLVAACSILWFCRWEGRKSYE